MMLSNVTVWRPHAESPESSICMLQATPNVLNPICPHVTNTRAAYSAGDACCTVMLCSTPPTHTSNGTQYHTKSLLIIHWPCQMAHKQLATTTHRGMLHVPERTSTTTQLARHAGKHLLLDTDEVPQHQTSKPTTHARVQHAAMQLPARPHSNSAGRRNMAACSVEATTTPAAYTMHPGPNVHTFVSTTQAVPCAAGQPS